MLRLLHQQMYRQLFRRRGVAFLALLGVAPMVLGAEANLVSGREASRQFAQAADIAAGYAALINFESEPYLSSSTLWIDNGALNDDRLKVTKFPLRYDFDLAGRSWKPFVQLTLAKLTMDQTVRVFESDKVKSEWSSYSGSFGGGLRFPLKDGWSLLPSVDFGYASIDNRARFHGEQANRIVRPATDKILYNWSADSWLANAHLAVQHQGQVGAVALETTLSGTYSHIESYRTTTPLQEFQENIGSLVLQMDGTYALGVSMAGYPLSLIGHLGASTFVGPNRDALGFTHTYEAGMSVEADISRHDLPLSKLSLGLMGVMGDNVKGWSFLFGFDF